MQINKWSYLTLFGQRCFLCLRNNHHATFGANLLFIKRRDFTWYKMWLSFGKKVKSLNEFSCFGSEYEITSSSKSTIETLEKGVKYVQN